MKYRAAIVLALFVIALTCIPAIASSGSGSAGGDLPWTSGLSNLVDALSGRTALYISMVGLFFAGGILIFGGDLGNFGRMVMMVVLVGSTLTGLNAIITQFLGSGALLM